MKRSLLTPRWLLLHLLFVVAVLATVWLGWWQWQRAHEAGGSYQNLGYALQWPMFGVFTIYLWFRITRMEIRGKGSADSLSEAADSQTSEPDDTGDEPQRRKRPLVPPPAPPVDAAEDPELAAYNQYLAELNAWEKGR